MDPLMRQAKLGKPISAETRAKLSAVRKARWLDPEYRSKMISKFRRAWAPGGSRRAREQARTTGEVRHDH